MFTVVKPGDSVVLDYTMNDINGNPIITSNQMIYTRTAEKGRDILISKQLSMVTGQNLTKSIYPVSIYGSSGWSKEYALFSVEYEAINSALAGMKTGEQKRVLLPNTSMVQEWSAEQLTRNGVDIGDLNLGDGLAMSVSDNPDAVITNTSVTYTRVGQVTGKTNDTLTVDFGYPSVDISIISINANS